MSQSPIICLMGPTASGKTSLAIELVRRNPALEIISADSALVYRGLDIGTAKPTPDMLAEAPHRLIDIRDPTETYSAGDFRKDALQEISKIHQLGKIPLIVGGTMMYFWILQNGLAELPKADPAIREQIAGRAMVEGWPSLHRELAQVDPAAATKIHPSDGQRIQRALEVWMVTGQSISTWQAQHTHSLSAPVLNIILAPQDRDLLTQRIQQRLESLFARGFIDEVQNLRSQFNLHPDLPALRTVGYRQVWQYLESQYDLKTLHQQVFYSTCQLAKRQMTWLRRWPKAEWLSIENSQNTLCEKILSLVDN